MAEYKIKLKEAKIFTIEEEKELQNYKPLLKKIMPQLKALENERKQALYNKFRFD